MANITIPSSILAGIGNVEYGIGYNVQIEVARNDFVTTFQLPGGRWLASLRFEASLESPGNLLRPRIEALIASLEGGANRLILPHYGRSIPNGTLRGAPQLASTLITGSRQMTIGNANGNVKAGDILGLPNQFVMVTADANPISTNLIVNFVPPIRAQHNSGTPVVWSQPTASFIPRSPIAGPFPYAMARERPAFSIDLVEV